MMPGIADSYLRYPRRAPSVCGVTSVPYALGVFRRLAAPVQEEDGDDGEFTGLVVGDRVRDVSGLGTQRNHCVSK